MDPRLTTFIDQSKAYLDGKRSFLEDVETKVFNYLEKHLINNNELKNISTHIRIKASNSLAEKIIRKKVLKDSSITPQEYIDKLKDIIGVRLVCLLNEEEELLMENIRERFNTESIKPGFKQLSDANLNEGYLIIDVSNQPEVQKNKKKIYKMECAWIENGNSTPVEMQLKSLVHMFWGELEHRLIYKNYSYNEHQSFHEDILSSISDLLTNIDYQLSTINSHISVKTDKQQEIRAKEMLTTQMSHILQSQLNQLLIDYDVDFRKVYVLLVNMLFNGKDYDAIVEVLTSKIQRLNELEVMDEDFVFTHDDLVIDRGDHLKPLGEIISEMVLSTDVMWRVLFGLYHKFERNNTIKRSYKAFIEELDSLISEKIQGKKQELYYVIDEDLVKEVYEIALQSGIETALNRYQDIDFFIKGIKLNQVLQLTEEFIDFLISHSDDINDDKSTAENKEELKLLLTQKLALQLLLGISKNNVMHEELVNLTKDLQTFDYLTFDLDYRKIETMLSGGTMSEIDSDKLINLLNHKPEGNEDDSDA